jgi:hypothetical protein
MENWSKLCKAASQENSECSPQESFISGLTFLKLQGIDNLEAATEQEIQTAWHMFVSNQEMFDNFQFLYTPKD